MNETIEKRFLNVSNSKTFKNIIKSFDLDKKSVLDLGCSNGEFLAFFGPKSVGLTIIKDEAIYGRSKGLDIRCANIESDELVLNEKFDVIFANNLFEHLYSPHKFLRNISKYLKPGGLLILGVPCIPKVVSLLNFRKFNGSLASLHINFFTRESLIETVKCAGWHVDETRGFRFMNPFFDHLLNPIYPHFYVVASPDSEFRYSEKKMKELAGYAK